MAIPKNPFAITGSSETERSANRGGPQEFSAVRGGTFRTIDGVRYKNGEIPENKLRAINNASKYIGAITSDGGKIRLYDKASLALDRLILAAEQARIPVKINSAYRTFNDQVRVRRQYPNDSAEPGTSNHGFGLAVDFATPGLQRIKPGDKLYDWLAINGTKFGFKRIKKESWHWEYQA
jgi:LAS superfamily LD-carboxypeptidase LdcB